MKCKKIIYSIFFSLFFLIGCTNSDIKELVNSSIYIPLETTGAYYPTPINTAVNIDLQANKSTANLAFIIQSQPYKGTLSQSLTEKNKFIYTPNLNYNGPDSFKFYVTDGTNSSNVSEITLFVGESLVAFDKTISSFVEDNYKDIILQVNNPNLATLEFHVNQPSNGTVAQISGSTWRYTPKLNYYGNDSFTFYASAPGFLNSNTATISISISSENDPPVTLPRSISTNEDSSVDITLNATDAESNPLTFSIQTYPANGLCVLNGSTVTYTPYEHFNGTDTFTYFAKDAGSDSNVSTVTVTVNPLHDTPVTRNQLIVVKNYTTSQGTLIFDFNLDNPDNGELTYNFFDVSHGSLTQVSGTKWEFKAEQNYFGQFEFTYNVSDSTNTPSNTSTVTVNIVPANVIYVNANLITTNVKDGTSWETAFNEVSDAMNAATDPGTDIWVASGTYNSSNIIIKNGVSILGGFNGTEFNPNSRNSSNPPTILDAKSISSTHALKGDSIVGVTIDRLTITGGNADGFSESYYGGGIFINNASNITIKNCIFNSNKAGKGGAVYLANTTNAQLTDNTFTNNTASANGGAIYFASVTNSKITCSSGTGDISSNESSGDGGAVFIDQNSGTNVLPVILENYELTTNTSGANGGAICNNGNSLINTCSITGNTANNFGGGIADSTGISVIQSSTISNNKAGLGGGGIYTLSITNTALLTINSSIISGNTIKDDSTAQFYGGGIYNDRMNGLVINNSSIINHNNKITYGGGIYSTGTLQIFGTLFDKNEVSDIGGAILSSGYCSIDKYNITKTVFSHNKSAKNGGAIFNYPGSRCVINNATFSDNQIINITSPPVNVNDPYLNFNGGAICSYKHVSLSISNSEFINNSAKSLTGSMGGAICDLHVLDNTTITDTKFTDNKIIFDTANTSPDWSKLVYSGGAVYFYNSISTASYGIYGSTFTGNSALNKGGAIYHYNSKSGAQFKIENSVFDSNFTNNENDPTDPVNPAVKCSGGAVHIENNQATANYLIKGSHFIHNYTTGFGTAIYSDSAFEIVIDETLFQENSGSIKLISVPNNDPDIPPSISYHLFVKGTFYNKNKAKFTNTVFGGNNNVVSGGAIYNTLNGSLSAINCLVIYNSSTTNGSGLYNESSSNTVSLINSTFANNSNNAIFTTTNSINILNSIISGSINNSAITVNYSRTDSTYTGTENIILNPSFITNSSVKLFGYSIGSYFLKQTTPNKSPCIDAGKPGVLNIPVEITGKTTAIDQTIDNDPIDMGYHYKLW